MSDMAGDRIEGSRPQAIIRPYESGDAAAVRDLFVAVNRQLSPTRSTGEFEAYIRLALSEEMNDVGAYYAAHDGHFFVAMIDDRVVGMFGLERAGPDALELRRMYVAGTARRRGLGRALLARAEDEARAADVTRLILSTSELQPEAIAL